ncbi:TetR/AcrR family transcriptional regulator [Blastococcus sp. TF02A-26]|nr:TetR/AcrR family transcriptional regulator [Blastococcus sp. TF02A-26]
MADDVLGRVVQRALSRRGETYEEEVRRLMEAGLAVMVRCGTSASPRVSDIVAAAGLSNDAFYRYFPSKGALVGALLEDGAQRLRSYLEHQMAKETTPEGRVRRWVEGVLTQARGEVAATTRAVMWNAPTAGSDAPYGRHFASGVLADLLVAPYAELGSGDPVAHARLSAHAVLGVLSDHVWAESAPDEAEREQIVAFCLAAARATAVRA